MSTDLRTRLQSALLPAMRAGDADTVAVVRSALAALANAEAVRVPSSGPLADGPIAGSATGVGSTEAPRRTLTGDEVRAVVERERQERLRAAEESQAGGLGEYAARLKAQAATLAFFLETTP
jgi:uncharacterized protein